MAQAGSGSPSFDMSKLKTSGKIVLISSILYLIDLFLPWNRACAGGGSIGGVSIPQVCFSWTGVHGLGVLNLILVLAVIALEIVMLMGIDMNIGQPEQKALINAGLIWLITILTLIKVLLVDNNEIYWGAWVGIILAVIMAYGGFMRFQEGKTGEGAAPASGGSGFTS